MLICGKGITYTMNNWFTFKMWFNLHPGSLLPVFQNILIGLLIVFLIATGVTWFFYSKKKKTLYAKIWSSFYAFSLTGTIIGAFLLFFTYEGVPFLSARFWFIIWFLVQAVWLYFIIKKLRKLPEIRKEIKDRKEYNKYIP